MKLVIDTSALVSIETVNLVSKVLKYFKILISDTVEQELSESKGIMEQKRLNSS